MDEICKFGEQTSRILEFKPEGLDFQSSNKLEQFKFKLEKKYFVQNESNSQIR